MGTNKNNGGKPTSGQKTSSRLPKAGPILYQTVTVSIRYFQHISTPSKKKCAVPWAAQLSLLGPIGTLNRACEEGQKSKASWPYGIRHVLCTGSGGCDSHFRRFLLCTISIQRLLPRILYAITLPLHTNARQQPVDGNCAKAGCNGRSLCCRHGGVSSVLFGNTLMTVAASAIVQPYAQPQVLP